MYTLHGLILQRLLTSREKYRLNLSSKEKRETSKMTKLNWTENDARISLAEGWGLFDHNGSAAGDVGTLRIERFDDAKIFVDDAAAWVHVVKRAHEGSPLHYKALSVIAEDNTTERDAIFWHTGFMVMA